MSGVEPERRHSNAMTMITLKCYGDDNKIALTVHPNLRVVCFTVLTRSQIKRMNKIIPKYINFYRNKSGAGRTCTCIRGSGC